MFRRTSTLVAALAATATLSTGLVAPAQAGPADSGISWTSRELGQDRLFTTTFDGTTYVDHGLTIDAGLAFADLGRGKRVRQVRAALAPHMSDYASFGANAVAKGLVWAQTSGADPRNYGSVDWVTTLEDKTSDSGRISDGSGDTDYANTLGQSYALQGLWRAGSAERRAALGFLLEQQCRRGYFRLYFSPADAADQSCSGGAGGREANVDATGIAVLALQTLPRRNAKARQAIADATRWLKRRQARDGSFGGGTGTSAANANSTGVAARALGASGQCRPAKRAARWVQGVQVRGKVRRTPYAGDKGAIAYDRRAYRVGKRRGITADTRGQFQRATLQAVAALRYRSGC